MGARQLTWPGGSCFVLGLAQQAIQVASSLTKPLPGVGHAPRLTLEQRDSPAAVGEEVVQPPDESGPVGGSHLGFDPARLFVGQHRERLAGQPARGGPIERVARELVRPR